MSSFMKDVVAEVLQRNRTPALAGPATPVASAVSCTADSKKNCTYTCSTPGNCPKPELALPLKRINYQKEQAARRLASIAAEAAAAIGNVQPRSPGGASFASATGTAVPSLPVADPAFPAQAGSLLKQAVPPANEPQGQGRQFAEQYLSPLLQRTLARPEQQNNSSPGSAPARSFVPAEAQDPLEPVRLPAADMEVWLFPRIRDDFRPLLGSPGRNYSAAGVISAPSCHPGQLFAAEELLPQDSGLEADISWSADGGSFELKLFGQDYQLVADKLKQLTARMQDGANSAVRVWISREPGRLLRRYFSGGPQEAVAVVAGSTHWNSIGIAEQWLQRNPGSGLRLCTERGYCILTGTAEQMAASAPGLAGLSAPCRRT